MSEDTSKQDDSRAAAAAGGAGSGVDSGTATVSGGGADDKKVAVVGNGGTAAVIAAAAASTAAIRDPKADRPAFLAELSNAYNNRNKSVVVLTGNIKDLFYSENKRFLDLEQTLYQALKASFRVLRLDLATGIAAYDPADLDALEVNCARADRLDNTRKMGNFKEQVAETRHSPLPAIVLLSEVLESLDSLMKVAKELKTDTAAKGLAEKEARETKPIATIVKISGAIFPPGDFDKLNEADRQRLVTFLNLIESPWFKASQHLVILLAETRSELNSRIVTLPSVQCVEIALPSAPERGRFVDTLTKGEGLAPVTFDKGGEVFIDDTAGLTLNAVQDLIEVARRTKKPVTRKVVLDEINRVMQADLGDLVKLSRPEHKPEDIVGYANVREILYRIFKRCENPDTAVPAILVSGPNGSGKTFQLEAYASDSGRVVIELVGLRGMYFGQTDGFFEKLRLRLATYGKVLILVDEAHTQFGSVHKSETHETEKRLAGNIIKMMGDPTMYGKVLWALMTSRPDELDPDVKSRCPVQIPIFDLEGDERITFVRGIFERKKIAIPDSDIAEVMERTSNYSARDYGFFVKEVKGCGLSALETLDVWSASASIAKQRRFQALVAAKHCSYPKLLTAEFAELVNKDAYDEELMRLKVLLGYRG